MRSDVSHLYHLKLFIQIKGALQHFFSFFGLEF